VDQHPDAPVTITSARPSRSADIKRRQTRYLISMGIRTACFIGAIIADGVLRWVLVGAAFVLPYISVVIANASERPRAATPASFRAEERPMIEGGRRNAADDADA
jgi:hypothetical protein